jgi:hypothetical protein
MGYSKAKLFMKTNLNAMGFFFHNLKCGYLKKAFHIYFGKEK